MATVGYLGSFDAWQYSGTNVNNYVTTVNAGNETMPEAGYVTQLSVYVNGFSSQLSLELFIWSETQGKYLVVTGVVTAPTGPKSVGGQSWVNVAISNAFIPKGESLRIGWWRYSGQDSVWSTATIAGHQWDDGYQPTAPDQGGALPASFSSQPGHAIGAYFIYSPAAPIVNSLSASSGHVGDTFQVYGNAFSNASAVHINGVNASFSIVSDTQITVTVPAGTGAAAATGTVTVTNPNGTGSGPSFSTQPVVNSLSSTLISTGQTLTINGSGLSAASSVSFATAGGVTPTVVNDGQITVVVPADATAGTLTVYVPGGNWVTGTVNIKPTISSFTPTNAAVGQTVTVTGTGFKGTNGAKINGTAASYSITNSTTVVVTVPSGATSGKIEIDVPSSSATSSATLNVVTRRFWRAGAWTLAQASYKWRVVGGVGQWVQETQIDTERAGTWVQDT